MQTLRSKYNRKKPVSYLFSQTRKPWPGFGPGPLPYQGNAISLDNDGEDKMIAGFRYVFLSKRNILYLPEGY